MSKIVKFTYKDFEKNITNNFKVKEFACKDGSKELYIDIELVDKKLQKTRDYIGRPIIIVCGYRTESYNKTCGGALNSKHLTGEAIDFTIEDFKINNDVMSPMNNTNIFYLANDLNNVFKIKRIGIYTHRATNFIHIDNGEEPLIWINDTKKIRYYNNVYDYLLNKRPIKEVNI